MGAGAVLVWDGGPYAMPLLRQNRFSQASVELSAALAQASAREERTGRLATIRTTSPSGSVVDFLFASSGIEPEIVAAATSLEILDGVLVSVASTGHLIATKILSRDDRERPQDRMDLHALFRVASGEDLQVARTALRLIESRGYDRDRALLDDLESALRELAP